MGLKIMSWSSKPFLPPGPVNTGERPVRASPWETAKGFIANLDHYFQVIDDTWSKKPKMNFSKKLSTVEQEILEEEFNEISF